MASGEHSPLGVNGWLLAWYKGPWIIIPISFSDAQTHNILSLASLIQPQRSHAVPVHHGCTSLSSFSVRNTYSFFRIHFKYTFLCDTSWIPAEIIALSVSALKYYLHLFNKIRHIVLVNMSGNSLQTVTLSYVPSHFSQFLSFYPSTCLHPSHIHVWNPLSKPLAPNKLWNPKLLKLRTSITWQVLGWHSKTEYTAVSLVIEMSIHTKCDIFLKSICLHIHSVQVLPLNEFRFLKAFWISDS